MTAFTYRMPAGIPGDISRKNSAVVEAQFANSSSLVYGNAVKMSSGKLVPIGAGDDESDVYGVLVRPYPTQSSQDPLGTSTPPSSGPVDVLKSGYISTHLYGSTAATKNGAVYVRIASAGAGELVGGFEAADDGSDAFLLSNAYFMGPADADGNVEIAFNI